MSPSVIGSRVKLAATGRIVSEKPGLPGKPKFAGFQATASYPRARAMKLPPTPAAAALVLSCWAPAVAKAATEMNVATRDARSHGLDERRITDSPCAW